VTPEQRKNLDRLMSPRHIAFVGGADAIVAIGEARRRGFTGEFWPVNPKRAELAGIPCYASVDDLPQAPDAVFLAVPVAAALETIAKLAAMGAGGVVCYSAGFKESGADGAEAENRLKDAVGDMALIGPNCYGVINYLDNSALWPFAHGGDSPGYGAAIITQSGMFSSDITMSQRSVPLTHMISAGNQAVMGLEDFIEVLCENPAVRAIGVHIEGLQDIPKFERAALKALRANTPIVALKTGSSAIGSALTISHTGSLSGANELYQALFDRLAVISVTSPSQFLETLKYLCVVGVPAGNKVAGFTCSGGGATMLADHAETIGLDFPACDEDQARALAKLLPAIATVSNPLDYTTPIWGQSEFTEPVFTTAIAGNNVDSALLLQDYPAPGLDESKFCYQNDAKAFARAAASSGVPAAICATLPENMDAETRALLIENGVAPMQGIHETLNAIAAAAQWRQRAASILENPTSALAPRTISENMVLMDEAKGKSLLADAGLAVPAGQCVSGANTADVAASIGFPVVIKMMGPKLAHKTEAGAVALGLNNVEAVAQAVTAMRAAVLAYDKTAVTDCFLVEAMAISPVAELIVGIRRDPLFGPAMTLGSGGVLVELIGDATTLLLPCGQQDIRAAIASLKGAKLMQGFRGRPVVDFDALASHLADLAAFVQTSDTPIVELEINPLFVYEDKALAVDVLIHTEAGT